MLGIEILNRQRENPRKMDSGICTTVHSNGVVVHAVDSLRHDSRPQQNCVGDEEEKRGKDK